VVEGKERISGSYVYHLPCLCTRYQPIRHDVFDLQGILDMTVTVGDFKQQKYGDLAEQIRDVILSFSNDNHLALVEALGVLEMVKIELYDEQMQLELDQE